MDFDENFENSNALFDKWPIVCLEFQNILNSKPSKGGYAPNYGPDIQHFLALLKLLPTKASFKESSKSLIVFEKVGTIPARLSTSTVNDPELKKMFPFIVACGKEENEISHFFIDVEHERMNV